MVATEAKRHGNSDPLGRKKRKVDKRQESRTGNVGNMNNLAIQAYRGTTWQAVERLCSELRASARHDKTAADQDDACVRGYYSVGGEGWKQSSSAASPLDVGSARAGAATCTQIPEVEATFEHLEFKNYGLLKRAVIFPIT